jgi:large subunit ribosomal protein L10
MARADKSAAVAELTEQFRSSNAAVLTEYRGLTVAQLKELRVTLGGNATYAVVKNTLTKIAAKDAGIEGLNDLLVGPSAIAFVSGDPVEAAKGLRDFAKANPHLVIKGGVLEGAPLSVEDFKKLADLESREVLLAKLAGAMKASLQNAVSLFAAPLSQAARTIDALRAKAEADPSVLAGGAGTPAPVAEPVQESEQESAPAVSEADSSADDAAPAASDETTNTDADAAPAADAPEQAVAEETPEG